MNTTEAFTTVCGPANDREAQLLRDLEEQSHSSRERITILEREVNQLRGLLAGLLVGVECGTAHAEINAAADYFAQLSRGDKGSSLPAPIVTDAESAQLGVGAGTSLCPSCGDTEPMHEEGCESLIGLKEINPS